MIRQTKRTFSKRLIVANCVLAWGAIFSSMYYNQSQWIAVSAFGLIAAINAYYMNIGHKDLAKILNTAASGKDSSLIDMNSYNGPAMPEPGSEK